ncbi:MAG: ATP synthase F1 subunit gamma [Planctomycetota bacterium]
MANARELLKRKKSVQSTGKITRTMELVASAKLKKATEAAAAAEPYAAGLQELMRHLSQSVDEEETVGHPLMEQREVHSVALLVMTSDRGLCGAFNSNLVRLAVQLAAEHRRHGRQVHIIALARKAATTLRFFGESVAEAHSGLVEKPRYGQAQEVVEPIMERFRDRTYDLVQVVYPHFASRASQPPTVSTLLPAGLDEEQDEQEQQQAPGVDYLFHPDDPAQLLEGLVPQAVRTVFFSYLLQTSAGEHAARRIAMKNATDAAKDLVKAINSRYNRARQGKITQEIAEIVGAVEAMS